MAFDLQKDIFRKFHDLPYPGKLKKWEKVFEEMSYHTRKVKPEHLFLKRRPHEEHEIHEYRLANYEPITYGSMQKALDTLFRIFGGLNYTLLNKSKELTEFLKTYNVSEDEEQFNFEGLMQKVVLKRCIEDPNGLLVWYPSGDGVDDSSKKVQPQCDLVYSRDIRYWDSDCLIYLSNEQSDISSGGKENKTGKVYWVFTKTEFWKLKQSGEEKDEEYTPELIYTHNLNQIPAIVYGGDYNADKIYDSFFGCFLAFGNEALRQFSDWQAIMIQSGYPIREELHVDCTNPKCRNGKIDGKPCPTCGGSSHVVARTPFGVYIRKQANPLDSGKSGTAAVDQIPSVRFISPDVAVLQYSGQTWQDLIKQAEETLHVNLIRDPQSGVAKEYDRENQYSMLSKISDNFYDNIFYKSLLFIEKYLNRTEDVGFALVKPKSFRLKSEADITEEIGTMKEKNVPSFFLLEATKELAAKRFSNNPVSKKMFDIISELDPLYIYSVDEKDKMLLQNSIDQADYVRSYLAYSTLQQYARDITEDVFINKPDADIIKVVEVILDKKVQEKITKLPKETPPAPFIPGA
jgi:hypothetical protein